MLKKKIFGCFAVFISILFALAFFCGCAQSTIKKSDYCTVVVEDSPYCTIADSVVKTKKKGDAVFVIDVKPGYQITGADYPDYYVKFNNADSKYILTVKSVLYSTVVSLSFEENGARLLYFANGGERADGYDSSAPVRIFASKAHLRSNTAIGTDVFYRDGYVLTSWNTKADGSGERVGLGSRTQAFDGKMLYAQWRKCTDEKYFSFVDDDNVSVIVGYSGHEETVVTPTRHNGKPVVTIEKNAFCGADMTELVLSPSLTTVKELAFADSAVKTVTLYDNLSYVNDWSFKNCSIKTLRINAVEKPVYSGNYFDTFPDKYDWLLSHKDEKKIVLFSGSSTRFGYDSEQLREAFPSYQIVNMGVFAYVTATPQLLLIKDCMKEGDILLNAPEFDAAEHQFCYRNAFNPNLFAMTESNYDLLSMLDMTLYTGVFTSFYGFTSTRSDMPKKSYDLSASQFDEDGNPVSEASYNEYGDYVVFRPNAESVYPVYGLPVDYTVNSFREDTFISSINAMYQRFIDKGVAVYFTYAPRNKYALSQRSSLEERNLLDSYFREKLIVPVISPLEDSLYEGTYLFGTDNHLSTEGVRIRTELIIRDLKMQMSNDGIL